MKVDIRSRAVIVNKAHSNGFLFAIVIFFSSIFTGTVKIAYANVFGSEKVGLEKFESSILNDGRTKINPPNELRLEFFLLYVKDYFENFPCCDVGILFLCWRGFCSRSSVLLIILTSREM